MCACGRISEWSRTYSSRLVYVVLPIVCAGRCTVPVSVHISLFVYWSFFQPEQCFSKKKTVEIVFRGHYVLFVCIRTVRLPLPVYYHRAWRVARNQGSPVLYLYLYLYL
jgi:hypothetical protein